MSQPTAENSIVRLIQLYREAYEVSKKAVSNKKSLGGSNFYGEKFHKITVAISTIELEIEPLLTSYASAGNDLSGFETARTILKAPSSTPQQKYAAFKDVEVFCQSKLVQHIRSLAEYTTPKSEQILPVAIVQNAPGYYRMLIIQVNGCYENGWYDACSVMLRKFLESIIVEIYIKTNRADEIKKDGEFIPLEKLIDYVSNDPKLHFGRDTKKLFLEIKKIGDRAAHARYYLSTKQDIEIIRSNFRVAASELLHFAGY